MEIVSCAFVASTLQQHRHQSRMGEQSVITVQYMFIVSGIDMFMGDYII